VEANPQSTKDVNAGGSLPTLLEPKKEKHTCMLIMETFECCQFVLVLVWQPKAW
jgi:hypothetical protein